MKSFPLFLSLICISFSLFLGYTVLSPKPLPAPIGIAFDDVWLYHESDLIVTDNKESTVYLEDCRKDYDVYHSYYWDEEICVVHFHDTIPRD